MGAGAKALLVVAVIAGTGMIVHRTTRNAQLRNCASLTAFVPHGASESAQVAFLSDGLKIVLRPARRGYFGSEGSTTTYWVQGSAASWRACFAEDRLP